MKCWKNGCQLLEIWFLHKIILTLKCSNGGSRARFVEVPPADLGKVDQLQHPIELGWSSPVKFTPRDSACDAAAGSLLGNFLAEEENIPSSSFNVCDPNINQ